jgi:hypothetical protein
MYDLQEIEAIKRLKYRYLRCLDCKRWDELKECFIPDATAAYGGGKYSFETRDKIVEFLVEFLDHDTVLTMHHGHQPEIELTSETTATGVWALEDRVINLDLDITIRGAAFYRDEYVKVDGEWKFASTGYQRVYEEVESRKDTASLQVTDNMFVDTTG